jgi:hypothetical protein
MMRQREYGELQLAVWYAIEDEAQDVYLLEVFDNFISPEGRPRDILRFPGMGNLWLPGLYELSVFSRAEFERTVTASDPLIERVRAGLASGTATILWPQDESGQELAGLLRTAT